MSRLTMKNKRGEFYIPRRYEDGYGNNVVLSNEDCINKLGHYEDLEEQGKLAEVIRCKDCIRHGDEHIGAGWCDEHEHLTNDDDYCSYAVGRLAEMEGAENDS